jgi:hypothetical protein
MTMRLLFPFSSQDALVGIGRYQANKVGQADAGAPADISEARQILKCGIASYLASHAEAPATMPGSNQTRPGCHLIATITLE